MTWDYSVERQKSKKLLSTEQEIETTKEDFTIKEVFLSMHQWQHILRFNSEMLTTVTEKLNRFYLYHLYPSSKKVTGCA